MARLFIGIKLENQQKLIEISNSVRKQLPNSVANWVNPENFHLTLKFLGEIEDFYINSIRIPLTDISQKNISFPLHYNKLGFFGSISHPKVIWFDFKPNEKLTNLHRSIEKSLIEVGFEPHEKKYSPHLTFARVKKLSELNNFENILKSQHVHNEKVTVDKFQLIESILKPSGPVYNTVAEFNLR
jgi:RNA 2',3'-cyclic 3'-phosphodiesterase